MTADSSRAEIESLIPHRPPMLLVDRIVQRENARLVVEKRIRDDEFFLQGHYPNAPITPGVILCEACMQAGALLLAGMDLPAEGVPVATRMEKVKFRRMVRPGDVLTITVEFVEQLAGAYFLKAKGAVEGKEAVRLEFACALAEPPQ